jgi:limonene-1,2-epoxide hydrolase
MSGKLIGLFDAFTDGLAEKNIEKIMKLFTEDATYAVYALGYKPAKGKKAIKALIEADLKKVKDYNVNKLFVCEKENNLVVEWLVRFREVNSGKIVEMQGVSIMDVKNGLIHNWREYIQS